MIRELCRSKYYLDKHESILDIVKKQVTEKIEHVESDMLTLFYDFLHKEPYYYWDREIFHQTLESLEILVENHHSELQITEEVLEHFIFGLNAYKQTAEVINDLRRVNESPEIKTRLYRIPTYISIVEGSISNLYRTITLLLDQTTNKDYKSHNKLSSLCGILEKNNFNLLVRDINIDIRNAINHGRVIYKIVEGKPVLEFQYAKNREYHIEHLALYEFDDLIDRVFDVASSILLGLITFFNNYKNLYQFDFKEKLFVPFSLLALELSIPEARCHSINGLPENKQLNVDMYIENTDVGYIHQMAIMLAILIYERYDDYNKYMISFSNERMQTGWIRFTNNEVKRMSLDAQSFGDVIKEVKDRADSLVWPPSTEDINLNEIKYFRFPNYKDTKYSIDHIEDASLEDRKRLTGHLYIGDIDDREEIIKIIRDSIDWIKELKNVPSPTIFVINGEMEADSVYLNVYRKDTRKDKATIVSNDNFICKVDYNINGRTTLKHGGIGARFWNQLSKEELGNTMIAWNGTRYRQTHKKKIGRNEHCICGSKKKFKKCCGK